MNRRKIKSRYYQIIALIVFLMLALCIRLFVLMINENDRWSRAATAQNTKEVVSPAPRGEILDRYGRVLAGNKQVFTVQFNVSGLETDQINNTCYRLVKLFEQNGDSYADNFPIKLSKNGSCYYSYNREKKNYLKTLELPEDASPEDVLAKLRSEYDISEELDRYEAIDYLRTNCSVWPPIQPRSMTFTFDAKRKAFLSKYGLDTELGAREAFEKLKSNYSLDRFRGDDGELISDKMCRKIFRLREEIKNIGYNKYRSSTVAKGVSDKTVAYIEEMGRKLPGAEVSSETARVYPAGTTAAHILGYMGSISDSQYEEYVNQKGYSADDLIGKDGLEASMEEYLHGKDGVKTILVNSFGEYMETMSVREQEAGRDVYTTIDLELQKNCERTLKKVIECVASGKTFKSRYGNIKPEKFSKCKSGAVVALDVKTGEVLAMASYPTYDPAIFAEGISTKAWESVQAENPRDSLSPIPLFNNATRASVQPGSTFKPVTAIAALKCGLDPNRAITDRGHIDLGGTSFGCSAWNTYRGTHGVQTLTTGIQNSCNYYFACIATGKDWGSGAYLGYKERISIEKIMEAAAEFGLGEKTGVELYETITPLASKEGRLETVKNMLYYHLITNSRSYWPSSVFKDEAKLKEEVSLIVSWTEENPPRDALISRLKKETSVRSAKTDSLADLCKYSFFGLTEWGVGDSFNISIGQGDNAYTPLQMARYIAALGNKGIRRSVSVIKGTEGGEYVKTVEKHKIKADKKDIETVLLGMRKVVQSGTLSGTFRNFPIAVCGKTGTAEKDGRINPKNEVKYIMNNLSRITSKVRWKQVEKKMRELMKEDPKKYPTENDAVDTALIEASGNTLRQSSIDRFKPKYDNFAWTVTLAPYDNPKIAVVTLLVQGGISSNAAIVNREITGAYLLNNEGDYSLDFSAKMN